MAPRKAEATEWPRLDLPKHQIQSLSLSWFTETEDFAASDYGLDLLEDLIQEGMYSALVRYVRTRTNLRCVQVAMPRFEGGYDVYVQYEHDPEWLPLTMTNDKPSVEAFAALARKSPTRQRRVPGRVPLPGGG